MITKEVCIGDKKVLFGASAGTLRRYRVLFGGDLIAEMQKLDTNKVNTDVLEKLAYVMAKQANPDMEEDIDEWLDQFGTVEFMGALNEIIALWIQNNETASTSKKK